ncbi:hypothetical protein FOCC_FOCC000908 [Frankliniella occidentalis]|nr:hypothetical protein FOCC_FOCC000908 [Frankliniella occidentalis]
MYKVTVALLAIAAVAAAINIPNENVHHGNYQNHKTGGQDVAQKQKYILQLLKNVSQKNMYPELVALGQAWNPEQFANQDSTLPPAAETPVDMAAQECRPVQVSKNSSAGRLVEEGREKIRATWGLIAVERRGGGMGRGAVEEEEEAAAEEEKEEEEEEEEEEERSPHQTHALLRPLTPTPGNNGEPDSHIKAIQEKPSASNEHLDGPALRLTVTNSNIAGVRGAAMPSRELCPARLEASPLQRLGCRYPFHVEARQGNSKQRRQRRPELRFN